MPRFVSVVQLDLERVSVKRKSTHMFLMFTYELKTEKRALHHFLIFQEKLRLIVIDYFSARVPLCVLCALEDTILLYW